MSEVLKQLPSFIVAAMGLLVMMHIGSGKRHAWILAVLSELVWIAYAIWLKQLGLAIISCLYGVVYYRNWLKAAQ